MTHFKTYNLTFVQWFKKFCNLSFLRHPPEDGDNCGRNTYEAYCLYNMTLKCLHAFVGLITISNQLTACSWVIEILLQ